MWPYRRYRWSAAAGAEQRRVALTWASLRSLIGMPIVEVMTAAVMDGYGRLVLSWMGVCDCFRSADWSSQIPGATGRWVGCRFPNCRSFPGWWVWWRRARKAVRGRFAGRSLGGWLGCRRPNGAQTSQQPFISRHRRLRVLRLSNSFEHASNPAEPHRSKRSPVDSHALSQRATVPNVSMARKAVFSLGPLPKRRCSSSGPWPVPSRIPATTS